MNGMPPHSHFSGMGTQAQIMSRNCKDAKLAAAFQYVAIGSMVIMGIAGLAHLIKDIGGSWSREPACRRHREVCDEVEHHHGRGRH